MSFFGYLFIFIEIININWLCVFMNVDLIIFRLYRFFIMICLILLINKILLLLFLLRLNYIVIVYTYLLLLLVFSITKWIRELLIIFLMVILILVLILLISLLVECKALCIVIVYVLVGDILHVWRWLYLLETYHLGFVDVG